MNNAGYWLTDFSPQEAGSPALYRMAKSRWEIENQGFNDAKNRYGFAHICHHHPTSLLITGLLVALALTLERLFRARYLHRGTHRVLEPAALVRWLWLSVAQAPDTS
jgi:hypothetical protein